MNSNTRKNRHNSSSPAANSTEGTTRKSDTHQGIIDKRSEFASQRQWVDLVQNPPIGSAPVQRKENNTGLPDDLKSGIESLSGYSMDHVKVHYNSDRPAQLRAHAFAQGSSIHLARGQEKHLPHEAWHVVQQMQGRVQPTIQMKEGPDINDQAELESEADRMGEKALQAKAKPSARLREAGLSQSTSAVQLMPQNRKEFKEARAYLIKAARPNLYSNEAVMLLTRLDIYSHLKRLPTTNRGGKEVYNDTLIDAIKEGIDNSNIQQEFKQACIAADPTGGLERWKFILQHLKSGLHDELMEYKPFKDRWFGLTGRVNKWGTVSSTLMVQGAMQAIMGNEVSAAAFAVRSISQQIKLFIVNTVSLAQKIEHPVGYRRLITGVSMFMEVAKFFETWTKAGLTDDKMALLRKISNYMKKVRAALLFIKEAVLHIVPKSLAPFDKYFNVSVGMLEAILNFCSVSDKNVAPDIINNVAKMIKHLFSGGIEMFKHIYKVLKEMATKPRVRAASGGIKVDLWRCTFWMMLAPLI
ncbi:DUF4157 domain-containing protein [bacterium SCSIO 12741]|nr:DUF4157 domain-containing protein [bacterium SCSIO 12741]